MATEMRDESIEMGIGVPRIAALAALAALGFLVALGIDKSPFLPAAAAIGATGLLALVFYPFLGLVILVFGSQLSAAIEAFLPFGQWFLEGVAAVTIVGLLLNAYKDARRERWLGGTPAVRFAGLFTLALLMSFVLAENTDLAASGLRKIGSLLVLFYLIVRMATTPKRVAILVIAILVSTGISCAIAVYGGLTGTIVVPVDEPTDAVRQSGGTGDPTMGSHAMLAGTALAALLAARDRRWRPLAIPVAALGCGGILFSYARSTALLLVLLAIWLLFKLRRQRFIPVAVVAALVLGIGVIAALPQMYRTRLSALTDPSKDWTLKRRFGYHVIAIDLFQSHPLLGIGPRNFEGKYVDSKYRWVPGRTPEPRALHNMYLAILVEHGLVGFVCFMGMLGAALLGLHRTRRLARAPDVRLHAEAVEFGFAAFLVACAVVPAQTSKYTWIFAALAVALQRLESFEPAEPVSAAPVPLRATPRLLPGA